MYEFTYKELRTTQNICKVNEIIYEMFVFFIFFTSTLIICSMLYLTFTDLYL